MTLFKKYIPTERETLVYHLKCERNYDHASIAAKLGIKVESSRNTLRRYFWKEEIRTKLARM